MAVSLAYEQFGREGRPLVVVHGWCCRRDHMRGLAVDLSSDYCVFCPDLPGHGDTPSGGSCEFPALAHAIVGFLEEHALTDVVLIGHSMGGVLSVITSTLTDRVTAVVNIDGALPLRPQARDAYVTLFQDIQSRGYRVTVEDFTDRTFFLPHEHGPVADGIKADMLTVPEKTGLALLRQFPLLDAPAILSRLRVPALYLGADTPRFEEAFIRAHHPAIQVEQLPGHGHFLQTFACLQVAAAVRRFLS